MSIYDTMKERGYRVQPSPRLNPHGWLSHPWQMVAADGYVVLRANDRDQLEERALGYFKRLDKRLAKDAARNILGAMDAFPKNLKVTP